MAMSRKDLIDWVNTLLQLDATKVEDMGKGAVPCQIFDSIFGDLPMAKVKFNAKTITEFSQNLKILQQAFNKHGVTTVSLKIEDLVRCKPQDNLALLQDAKKFWDQHYVGPYDAIARRQGAGSGGRHSSAATRVEAAPTGRPVYRAPRLGAAAGGGGGLGGRSSAQLQQLEQDNAALKEAMAQMEVERDFYYQKLRDIELLAEQAVEEEPEIEKDEEGLVKLIQKVLYMTADGFEIPAGEGGEVLDDQETF